MRKTMRLLGIAAACAFFAACASMGKPVPTSQRQSTTVVVDNRGVLDMNIYIIRGGERIRLGTANAMHTTRLTIPQGVISGSTDVRFLADPIGGNRSPLSEEITVLEGDEVTLTLPPF